MKWGRPSRPHFYENMTKLLNNKIALAAAALLITLFSLFPVVNNSFTNWDDDRYVTKNSEIKEFSPASLKHIFTSTHYGLYKPLVLASFAAEYHMFGLNPRPYHITNLTLHLINTLLVFLLILELGFPPWTAFGVSLLFGIHPMHVESVAWVTERKDMLYGLFFIGAMLAYTRYLNTKSKTAYIWSVVFFPLSLMAKPMGLPLPAALLLIDYVKRRPFSSMVIKDKIPHVLIALAFTLGTMITLKSANGIDTTFTLMDKVLFPFYGLAFYMFRLFVPVHLSTLYPYPEPGTAGTTPAYWLAVLFVLAALWGLWKMRRNRTVVFGALLFLITVLPVLQWIPVGQSITSDRYTYFPYVGLFLLVCEALRVFWEKLEKPVTKKLLAAFGAALVISMSLTTAVRAKVWRNSTTLWDDVLRQYPKSQIALSNRAQASLADGYTDKAIGLYASALDENMKSAALLNNRAGAYQSKGDFERSIADYHQVIKLAPRYADAYYNLGLVYARQGNDEKGIELLSQATRINPTLAEAFISIGDIYLRQANTAKAREYFNKALDANRHYAPAAVNLGVLSQREGDAKSAAEFFKRAISMDPYNEEALFAMGNMKMGEGDTGAARNYFTKLLKQNPAHSGALSNMGNIARSEGDRTQARQFYIAAINADPSSANASYNLSTLFYEDGDIKNARLFLDRAKKLGRDIPDIYLQKMRDAEKASLKKH